ncbi:hypothetical protein SAMN02745866_01076 [Alteromonadaceae bacterium Bs31]|nr:hypothetical protein SAMN02745866_01076 [Alteromonadaceae bacterium Bs31]
MIIRIILLMVLVAQSATTLADRVNTKKIYKEKWLSLESENFTVITNAGEKKGKALTKELERFRYFMSEILSYTQAPLSKKILVIAAKSGSTFKMFGINRDYTGVFAKQGDTTTIFANSAKFAPSNNGRANQGRQVILHELAHLIAYNSPLKLAMPPWYSEGMAEYFGTYVEKDQQIMLGQMGLVQYRFYLLMNSSGTKMESIETEKLLKAESTGGSFNSSRKEERELGRFYARSFGLVHYLNADHNRRRQMYLYLHHLYKGMSVDAAFGAAFNSSYEEMDAAVLKYLTGRYVSARVFNIGINGVTFPQIAITAEPVEADTALQLILSRINTLGLPFFSDTDKSRMLEDARKIYPEISL